MINVVLYQPEIPPNTGNIIRLCANLGVGLHIIKPMGFVWDDKKLSQAKLDYEEYVDVKFYESWEEFITVHQGINIYAMTTKGSTHYQTLSYQDGDFFIFGPESRGLPEDIRLACTGRVRIPMRPESRSMNLSNTVAVTVCEALRQLDFPGCI